MYPLLRRKFVVLSFSALFCFGPTLPAWAQSVDRDKAILERLDRLEKQNQQLLDEIKALRALVSSSKEKAEEPTAATTEQGSEKTDTESIAERQQVSEHRIEEQAQTKVEASQRYPIHLTGMALFNAFTNGSYNGGSQNPTAAAVSASPRNTGATVRQSVLGLTFNGPTTFLGGAVSGSIYMDFFNGSAQSLNHILRIRLATIQLDWPNTTFAVGQDKPLVSRREPNSLAQVGVSPLTNAGNPWLWQPQARIEQRFHLPGKTQLKAEVGVFQTSETTNIPADLASRVEASRPALETRLGVKREWGEKVVEVASAFHTSTTHLGGVSIPSRLFAVDWLVKPLNHLEITGMVFRGQNFANLGAIGGSSLTTQGQVIGVHGNGGWVQFRYVVTPKLSFDFYGGQQDDRNRDLTVGRIGKNQYYAANVMYLIAPNVISAFEVGQARTTYLGIGNRLNNHYDLALGYLF